MKSRICSRTRDCHFPHHHLPFIETVCLEGHLEGTTTNKPITFTLLLNFDLLESTFYRKQFFVRHLSLNNAMADTGTDNITDFSTTFDSLSR